MRPVDVKSNTYINSSKEINDENPKFKIGDNVRILTSKSIFAKCYGLKNVLQLKKIKTLRHGHMVLVILTEKKLLEYFTKKLQNPNQKKFGVEKVIKRKDDKLYVKW